LRLQKVIQYPNKVELPEPQWAKVFHDALKTTAGYSFAVLHNGHLVAEGAVNNSRLAQDTQKDWKLNTRINLASVSKPITAVAVLQLFGDLNLSVDDPFYPLVKSQFPTVGPGVDKVTIRNLLEMKSGMTADGTLYAPSIWTFLSTYLQNQNIPSGAPGTVYAYSNTNYTILQAVVDTLTGHGGQTPGYYATYVTNNVLIPMGIDPAAFNPFPDPQNSATLYYASASDVGHGAYWSHFDCVAAGGWVAPASELIKFLKGVRYSTVLSPEATKLMLNGSLGWYPYDGIYGQYFHHNGGLHTGGNPDQGVMTGIIHLSDNYDCLLLVNTYGIDPIALMIKAFETRQ